VTSATPVSGTRITGGGSGYAALLAHAGWVLYGMELGSVTLKINNQHTLANPLPKHRHWRGCSKHKRVVVWRAGCYVLEYAGGKAVLEGVGVG